jgi:D-arabinose 5-phosphate isomerase GutQ
MCYIERPARFISPAEAVHGGLGFLQKGDVILLASRGGRTDELLPIADVCRKKGVTIIGVTEKPESPLAEKSDVVLLMAVERECDKYNCQGTTSFAVTNAIFDALQTAVLEATEFKNEDFAVIHPGGAVGKRLNNK